MEGNVKTKRKKSKGEIVFICVMLAIPVLHFCLFWLYINLDTVVLSFQRFNMNEGVWEFHEGGERTAARGAQFFLRLFVE